MSNREYRNESYVADGGTKCPFCGSEEISGGGMQTDVGRAWQNMECEDCGSTWNDTYRLTGIEEL